LVQSQLKVTKYYNFY